MKMRREKIIHNKISSKQIHSELIKTVKISSLLLLVNGSAPAAAVEQEVVDGWMDGVSNKNYNNIKEGEVDKEKQQRKNTLYGFLGKEELDFESNCTTT